VVKNYILIGFIYHSHSASPVDSTIKLCTLMNEVLQSHPPYLLLVGDFNYLAIDWLNEGLSGNVYEQNFMILLITVCCFSMLLNQLGIEKALNHIFLTLFLLIKKNFDSCTELLC